MVFITWLVEG